jgi:hypothetical protein
VFLTVTDGQNWSGGRLAAPVAIITIKEETMEKTVTKAVIEANRENSQKSTGPQTEAGKEAVKNNAIKHGLFTSRLVFETDEEKERFEALCAHLEADLAPNGALEKMIVNDIAVSWSKLQIVHRLQVQELEARQGRAAEILNTFASNAQEMEHYYLTTSKPLSTSAASGWEFRELSLRNRTSKSKEEDEKYADRNFEGEGHIVFEAKLGNAAESLMRCENLWKKNLYRAMKIIREMQSQRLAVDKEDAILRNKAKK